MDIELGKPWDFSICGKQRSSTMTDLALEDNSWIETFELPQSDLYAAETNRIVDRFSMFSKEF